MLDTLAIVEIGSSSDRSSSSSAKLARRKFGNTTLLHWLVRRVSDCESIDRVVVVAADDPLSLRLRNLISQDTPIFINSQGDCLGRAAAAIREYDAMSVVRIPIECPFVDPVLLDRLVSTAADNPSYDYVGYCSGSGKPALGSRIGLFAEWCRGAAVLQSDDESTSRSDRQSFTSYIVSHPELFQLRFIGIPTELDRNDLRLSIDSEEDWDHAHEILEALGPESVDWRHIANLLDRNPSLRTE